MSIFVKASATKCFEGTLKLDDKVHMQKPLKYFK